MKTWRLAAIMSLLAVLGLETATTAAANDQNDQYAYVMVTGSLLPQRVRIHRIGTKTASPIRVYDRREIDQSGRFTTEDVLAQDPSLSVSHGMAGGGR